MTLDSLECCVIKLSEEPFDTASMLNQLGQGTAGAIASFIGHVRGEGSNGHELTALELEHYPGRTEKTLELLAQQMAARWPLLGIVIHHRIGKLEVGEPIVLVAVSSSHRSDALEAVDYAMDILKNSAFLWKKEHRSDGSTAWVEARISDDERAARWR